MYIRKLVGNFLFIFFAATFVCGCSHHSVKRENLVFKDTETQRRIQYLREKLRANPDDVDGHMELGRVFLSKHMTENAITEFNKVISIDSCNTQAYLLLSLALQKRPNPDLTKAGELLEKALQIEPDNDAVHLNLGQVYHKLGKKQKAAAELKEAIGLSEDAATLVSAHLGLAAVYKEQGDSIRAKDHCDIACGIYPELKEIIKQAEINRVCPAPKYAGEEFREEDGIHPPLEERIKQALEEIRNLSGEQK